MSDIANKILDKLHLSRTPSLPELLLHELDLLQQGVGNAVGGEKARKLVDTDLFLGARLLANTSATTEPVTSLADIVSWDSLPTILRQSAASTCFATLSSSRLRFLKQLYLQSVLARESARQLAERVLPETHDKFLLVQQAGFCGLFLNIGALALDQVFPDRYVELLQHAVSTRDLLNAEVGEFGIDHAQLGAALMQRWRVEDFCCDAVRYHHQEVNEIRDATPLVRIAWLANQLADEKDNPETEAWAKTLFAMEAGFLASVREAAFSGLTEISRTANVAFSTTRYLPLPEGEDDKVLQQEQVALDNLRERVEADFLIMAAGNVLSAADSPEAFSAALDAAVKLLHAPCRALLFALDAGAETLHCLAGTDTAIKASQLVIRCETHRSVIADCCLQDEALFQLPSRGLTVIDRQIHSLLGADNFCCEPLHHPDTGKVNGALVLGVPLHLSDSYKQQVTLRQALGRELGATLSRRKQGASAHSEIAVEYEKRISETIHEVNNPLGIIKNYLQLLGMKQDDDARVQSEIGFIKSEIDRIGIILEKLKAAPGRDAGKRTVDINALVTNLAGLISGSIGADKNVRIETRLDSTLPVIPCSEDALRQIITNLVKNAAEAIDKGGIITIETAGNIYMNGESYIQLSVKDDGPGIATEILDNLFAPGHSTKGDGHTGSGLAIVRNLVKNLKGQIACRTFAPQKIPGSENNGSGGTEFTILLPMTRSAEIAGDIPL